MTPTQLYLDPDEAARHKQQRHSHYNTVLLPSMRLGGYTLVLLLMWLSDVFDQALAPHLGVVYISVYAYCLLSWLALYLGFKRMPALELVFLSTDVIVYAVLVYMSGAEKSWLYVLMMVRAADQLNSSFRRVLYFAHFNTLCYLVMLFIAHAEEGASFSLQQAKMRFATVYLFNLYLMFTAQAASNLRRQTTEAIRMARELLERQQRTQRELERVSHHQDLLLSSAPDGIYTIDASGLCVTVNKAFLRMLGWSAADVIGHNAHALMHSKRSDGTDYPVTDCPIYQCLHGGTPVVEREEMFWKQDGGPIPVEVSGSPIIENGERVGVVVIFRDITQRRELARMKDEFLAIVSHELRTPLSALRGSLGLLASGSLGTLDPKGARMLEVALGSSQRLVRLVNDILDMERMASGHLALACVTSPVAAFINAAVAEVAGAAEKTDIRVEVQTAAGNANIDADRMVQALVNLLGNAIKFSPAGSTVRISFEQRGNDYLFGVHDSGRGIPSAQLSAIFERFFQVDASDSRQKGGAGLGLAITKAIIEGHNGRIWAESEEGKGSTFWFTLPLSAEQATSPALPESGRPTSTDRKA